MTCPPLFCEIAFDSVIFFVVTASLPNSAFGPSVSLASLSSFAVTPRLQTPQVFPRRGRKTLPSPFIKNLELHQFISKMFFFTSFLKPGGYRRLADTEEQTHRAASPDDSLFPHNESESDLFLPSSSVTHPQQKAILHCYWRLAAEGLLFVCNIYLFVIILLSLDVAPLGVRQKECGRLLGQWCRFITFLETSRSMGLPCTLYEITERTLVFFFLLFTFCFLSFAKEERLKRIKCILQCPDGRTASSTKSSASKAASACKVPSQESDQRSMPLGTTLLTVSPAPPSLSFNQAQHEVNGE